MAEFGLEVQFLLFSIELTTHHLLREMCQKGKGVSNPGPLVSCFEDYRRGGHQTSGG